MNVRQWIAGRFIRTVVESSFPWPVLQPHIDEVIAGDGVGPYPDMKKQWRLY
jgi:hypothetical protein